MGIVVAILLGILISGSASASEVSQTIPQVLIGEWHSDLAQCGNGEDESFLRIEKDRLFFYESAGPARAVVTRGRDIALILELSGEGETWLATEQFELSKGGTTLTSSSGGGARYVRHRCSSGRRARPNNSFKPKPLRGSA